jgi:photosynthetic reaction center H subunit
METGAITQYIDVAQIVLYIFWAFFFALVIYLLREGKREGYPLDPDGGRNDIGDFLLPIPPAKTYERAEGGTYSVPDGIFDTRPIKAVAMESFPGAPLAPTGDPMRDAIGPGAYSERQDVPDVTFDGKPRLVPMRVDDHFEIAPEDPDPRGMPVLGADYAQGGTLVDIWVDRSEAIARYYEVEVAGSGRVLLPVSMSRLHKNEGYVRVKSILGAHFKDVPKTKRPDQITHLEEDKVGAYYGGGALYATADRLGPVL